MQLSEIANHLIIVYYYLEACNYFECFEFLI